MCERKEKKYEETRRKIVSILLDGEKKPQGKLGKNDSYISKIVRKLEREGIVERNYQMSQAEYPNKKSKKPTIKGYHVILCSLNPTVKALSKIFYIVVNHQSNVFEIKGWDALKNSKFYQTMIPKLIDHFNEKLKAQGLPKLTERERMCFEEYALKYSPSFLMLVIDDKRDYARVIEDRTNMFRDTITKMYNSHLWEKECKKSIDQKVKKNRLPPLQKQLLIGMKGHLKEMFATTANNILVDISQNAWLIVVSGFIEFDMVNDYAIKDDRFWELYGRYLPFTSKLSMKTIEVAVEEEATE